MVVFCALRARAQSYARFVCSETSNGCVLRSPGSRAIICGLSTSGVEESLRSALSGLESNRICIYCAFGGHNGCVLRSQRLKNSRRCIYIYIEASETPMVAFCAL